MFKYIPIIVLALAFGIWGSAHAAEATNEVHSTATCANTSTAGLATNPGRISALLINDSTQTVWLAINQVAVANEGIRLNANGGSYYLTNADGNLDLEAINCIVASGTGLLLVTEWSN